MILVTVGVVIALAIIIQVGVSMPPQKFTFVVGREGGGYYQAAQAYQKIAKANGFDLEIQTSAGSEEALQLLETGAATAGFIQGGIAADHGDPLLVTSVANVFYEPVWIFYNRANFPNGIHFMYQLQGKRVAVGERDSGTHELALALLADNDATITNTTFLELPSSEAADQLSRGAIDAAYFVSTANAPVIQQLLRDPGVELMSTERAPAYVARHPYLSLVTLPGATFDLVKNVPDEDKLLLATTANLIVNNTIHPDIVRLLAMAAVHTHERGGFFETPWEFPNWAKTDLPPSKETIAYLERIKTGDSFLDNTFPFWVAALIDRYLIFVVPLALILLPFVSRSPLVYQWYMCKRINRWYKVVHDIELRVDTMTLFEVDSEIQNLDRLDDKLAKDLDVSETYWPAVYELRGHIAYVTRRLEKHKIRLQNPQADPGPQTESDEPLLQQEKQL